MSAYDNDPRVTCFSDGAFDVLRSETPRLAHVDPKPEGGFVAFAGLSLDGAAHFDTADDAIRSLIGDPQ